MEPMTWKKAQAHGGTENTEAKERDGLEAHRNQLLPGMTDDIVLANIAPKLPWRDFCSLAAVSQAWLHAMKSRKAYDMRVHHRTLESLVVLRYSPDDFEVEVCDESYHMLGPLPTRYHLSEPDFGPYHALGLCSTKDGLYFELPPLPVCKQGIPKLCHCVTLDSRIYVLGGGQLDSLQVYVLDLALGGPRQWKQCASMLRQKMSFTCAAFDGKLYVLGCDSVHFSEVYDPKGDTWSLIEPCRQRECRSTAVREAVAAREERDGLGGLLSLLELSLQSMLTSGVGEELFVISAQPDFSKILVDSDAAIEFAFTADVYHPVKDEWRVEKFYPRNDDFSAILFAAQGNVYRMKNRCISVLDINTKRWMMRHHCSFAEVEFDDEIIELSEFVRKVIAVGDELLAICGIDDMDIWMFQSEGFCGGKNMDFTWYTSKLCPSDLNPDSGFSWTPHRMYPIQL